MSTEKQAAVCLCCGQRKALHSFNRHALAQHDTPLWCSACVLGYEFARWKERFLTDRGYRERVKAVAFLRERIRQRLLLQGDGVSVVKTCTLCHQEQPLVAFAKAAVGTFLRASHCKACQNAQRRARDQDEPLRSKTQVQRSFVERDRLRERAKLYQRKRRATERANHTKENETHEH